MYSSNIFVSTRIVSSLEKVFCSEKLSADPVSFVQAAGGETSAFQVACKVPMPCEVKISADSEIASLISFRAVKHTPCTYPAHLGDNYVITTEPGLFPDPLVPSDTMFLSPAHWHSFWTDVKVPEDFKPGNYPVKIKIESVIPGQIPEQIIPFEIQILPFSLPEQKLINVNWFHADCLMTHYHVEAWSEKHWEILKKYFTDMVEHGNNSIFTPLWSIPLDTKIGHERPTCQLLRIFCENEQYTFDFSLLEKWIKLAKKCGFKYFEMVHAYTQWGAKNAPKIVVCEHNTEIKKFGWNTDADSVEYQNFMRQLMRQLLPFLRKQGITPDNCFFHISDEPSISVLENYRKASAFFQSIIEDFPIIDALSEIEFFKEGLIKRPVCVTNKLDEFMKESVEQRWTYYFGNWWDEVPNRAFGMPSARNRVFGVIMYLYGIEGMLNWGYNFWFSQLSLDQHLNPWTDPCAGGPFPGGGGFLVYPGEDGQPVDSLRFEVYREALQDMRAMQYLETLIGKEETHKLIHEGIWHKITITRYPHEAEWILNLRERVNRAIVDHLKR